MPRTGKDAGGGFTLLELLIAMALTSLVMLMVSSSLSFTSRMWIRAEDRQEKAGSVGSLVDLMGMQIGGYYAFDSGKAGNLPVVKGTATTLFVVTTHSVKSLNGGAPVVAAYLFDESSGKVAYYEIPADFGRLELLREFMRAPHLTEAKSVAYDAAGFELAYVSDSRDEPYHEWSGSMQGLLEIKIRWRETPDAQTQTRHVPAGYLDFLS